MIIQFLYDLLSLIPDFVLAALLLVVAIVVAGLARKLIVKLLKLVKFEKLLAKIGVKDENNDFVMDFIGKVIYFIVIMLFVPGILDNLGLSSVAAPIEGMIATFIAFIPKLVAAAVIAVIGVFLAGLIRDVLKPVLALIKIDRFQEKLGLKADDAVKFSNIILNIVYGLLLLIVFACAIGQLNIPVISTPVNNIIYKIFAVIPNILAAVVVIGIGIFIANIVSALLRGLLVSVGADLFVARITGNEEIKFSISKIAANVVKYLIALIFVVEGIQALGLPVLVSIGSAIIGYLPELLSVAIIVLAGGFAAFIVDKALAKKNACKVCVLIAKTLIYTVTAFLALIQLGIAEAVISTIFVLIIAALCVAFALAFGIGGREFAANTLKKVENKLDGDCCCKKDEE